MAKEKAEKQMSLEEALKSLEKEYGKGSVINAGNIDTSVSVISSGSIGLDAALGIGGWAEGKIIDLYGWESCGKSTLTQTMIGNYQKMGKKKTLLIDGENSLAPEYAKALGVDLDELLIIQLDATAGEGAYNKMKVLVETGEIGLVVIDSYNSLKPKKVMEGEVGDNAIGLHARMMSQILDIVNGLCTKFGTTFVFIGQLRQKIGVMYGSPDTPQGGVALRFYAHVRAEVTRSVTNDNSVKDDDGNKVGNKTTVKVVKNKLAAPFTQASFVIRYGEGIDKIQEVMDLGKELDILKIRAEKVTYGEDKYSEEEFYSLLKDNPEFYEAIREQILNKLKPQETNEPTNIAPALPSIGQEGDGI